MSSESLSRRDVRLKLLGQRDASPALLRSAWDALICRHLLAFLKDRFGNVDELSVGAYHPLGSEPDLRPIFSSFGLVALPKVVARDQPLKFINYREGTRLVAENFGVMVPAEGAEAMPALLILPCVGYHVSPNGRLDRLGYGGGYYDRTLADGTYCTVGVAYGLGQLATFQPEPHDRPLDFMVTEDGLIEGRRDG